MHFSPHLKWKSTAVMEMLKKEIGEDDFKTLIQILIKNAIKEIEDCSIPDKSIINTTSFIKKVI